MSDEEITRLHKRIDQLEETFKEYDKNNAERFSEIRKAILGDSVDAEQPGILRRILIIETWKNRMTRNAQLTWGFLLTVVAGLISWLIGLS